MQQQTGYPPPPKAPSFAGLLAALTSPETKRVPAWDDDLEDDVATISYEKALRAHARYSPVDAGVPTPNENIDADSIRIREVAPEQVGQSRDALVPEAGQTTKTSVSPNHIPSSPRERSLKCASITIRLSQTECAQLRTRASEAGLSISAYLRSCTFEAEALRAEVKQALAQLRTGESSGKAQDPTPARRSWFPWRMRTQG
ncbi:MAG: hypothetical protein ABSF28_18050 [Terracidiphilus sp.]|jgi:predicted DNA binding CopG/RHH family protein